MRFITIHEGAHLIPAVMTNEGAVRIDGTNGPRTMAEILEMGPDAAIEMASYAMAQPHRRLSRPIQLGPPVPQPSNIVCVGKNYPSHAAEEGESAPELPLLFSKHTSTVLGPDESIVWNPSSSGQIDYEAELAVVIGRRARHVPPDEALNYVFGYMAANDVSARDIQFSDGQWYRGKSLDTFMPTGPALVTADEINDPQDLQIVLRVNGVERQHARTSEMRHSIQDIISYASQWFTLLPSDIILTGTPGGVGVFREPPEFLQGGDSVEVEIETIGILRNSCSAKLQLS